MVDVHFIRQPRNEVSLSGVKTKTAVEWLPRAPLHGGGAGAESEEADNWDFELPKYVLGPAHLEVDYGADRVVWFRSSGEVGLEFWAHLAVAGFSSGGGGYSDDGGDGVEVGGGDVGGGGGWEDEDGSVVSGGEVFAELNTGEEMTWAWSCNNEYLSSYGHIHLWPPNYVISGWR